MAWLLLRIRSTGNLQDVNAALETLKDVILEISRWNATLEPIVREALLELRGLSSDVEYVFTNPDTGTRYTDVKKSFSAACREAGVTNFTFHDLRHTFGTRLADAG